MIFVKSRKIRSADSKCVYVWHDIYMAYMSRLEWQHFGVNYGFAVILADYLYGIYARNGLENRSKRANRLHHQYVCEYI